MIPEIIQISAAPRAVQGPFDPTLQQFGLDRAFEQRQDRIGTRADYTLA
ncbi:MULTISPECIES: hypothetical protein [Rhodopseudomonas]|nr:MULTISPECIES: hypothetical protein [Rhodopseudomonas]MDF3810716.1 hypothetical protein [Rhodopseudomonas sp. BAL398]WOK20522.1 hypothetical protein RBJ75_13815 [Rhodopseudomonas sp. BAL398]